LGPIVRRPKTRIACTLGPSSRSMDMLEKLLWAGIDERGWLQRRHSLCFHVGYTGIFIFSSRSLLQTDQKSPIFAPKTELHLGTFHLFNLLSSILYVNFNSFFPWYFFLNFCGY
jgi:hypothetical protein